MLLRQDADVVQTVSTISTWKKILICSKAGFFRYLPTLQSWLM
jgi:hypothetical protein